MLMSTIDQTGSIARDPGGRRGVTVACNRPMTSNARRGRQRARRRSGFGSGTDAGSGSGTGSAASSGSDVRIRPPLGDSFTSRRLRGAVQRAHRVQLRDNHAAAR